MTRYAFVGLGEMGYGMASNLRKEMPSLTFTLFIHDISEQVCHRFVSEFSQHGSIRIAHSAKHAAHAGACLFVSSLPSVAAVRNVYLDAADGLVGAPADPNRLILETNTIESSEAQAIAETLSEAGAGRYLDAPVSCGKPGAGLAAKICNNYIVCTAFIVLLEALALGVGSGCSAKVLLEVIHNSSGQTYIGDIMSKSRVGLSQSSTNLMLKDIALGVEAAAKAEIQIQVGQVALDIWKETARDPAVMDKYLKSLFGGDQL
ncbi:hypothetical protein BJX64DRAFT_291755 [Aspergillus heterothallicus]